MNKNPLFKYQIGLGAIGLFTLVLIVLVLVQAGAAKQDAKTDKKANEIADTLNNYVNSTGTVPATLQEAKVSDVPEAITYSRISDESYKFCVTYKVTSANFDSSAVALSLATGGKIDSGSFDYTDKSYLVIPSSHHKGKNCQTISPYSYSDFGGSGCGAVYCPIDSTSSDPTSSQDTTSNSGDDAARKTDINALDSHLEAFYAQEGYYPTLADLNNAGWVAINMKGLDPSALCDPRASASTCQLSSTEKTGNYMYEALDSDYKNCTTETQCASFTLNAQLADGSYYSKYSF
jgi:hypothetical protein